MTKLGSFMAGAMLALAGAAAATSASAETACADLAAKVLPHAQVTAATVESVGQSQACKISVTSKPTPQSDIRIEVWIPLGAAWNGKYVQLGNGGFAGTIPSGQIKAMAARGYAAAGTDDGHQSAVGTSGSWALGDHEKFVDFGWRALKETTDAAKALIAAQKGSGAKQAYFYGCSDGGREALMEAQRYPKDFDGVVAGAPAYSMSRLFGLGAAIDQALVKPDGYLGADQRAVLQSAALAQCGDGGFIHDPMSCRFDPAALQCKAGQDASKCLTSAQVASAKVIYGGLRDPRSGALITQGYSPGAESLGPSWPLWLTGATREGLSNSLIYGFVSNAFKYFAFEDPSFDMLKLDLGAEFARARATMAPTLDSTNPDLSAFRAHGGKLIQYHGWNDPAIPPRESIVYYEDVGRKMGKTDDFYRLYVVPGMLHCGGGPGPSNVDWLALLDTWVGSGARPGEVTATGGGQASQVLCPYPSAARRSGSQASYSCSTPKKR